jgi:D-3-phosphoglycerate dehydrogenase
MTRILANDGIHPSGKILLEDAGFIVDTEKIPQNELLDRLPAYDVICVRSATKVRKNLIDACPNLKIIARGGVGLDNIDVDYAKNKGLNVINTPAASSRSVAELVFAHMFSLSRFLYQSNREMPSKGISEFKALKKSYSKGFELGGRALGIIGIGRIGQEVAKIGLGIGMRVLATDPVVDEVDLHIKFNDQDKTQISLDLNTVEMDVLLRECDFITLHVPSLGRPILGAEEFSKMRDGTILINAARGGVVDEDALLQALESGKILKAGLDVFENEPTPRKELMDHPSVSLTPHIGASTDEAQTNIGVELAEKIIAALS